MKDLDPAALDALAALADTASFERAAQRLAITQSAVSQRLRTLELQVGQPLVVRSRPLRLTEPGKLLLRFARQLQAMRADLALELGEAPASDQRLPIAVNADSLATWVLPALDALVHEGLSLELVVDDQDFTHDWLRQGAVLGCVTSISEALRGCRVVPLGAMHYTAVASPGFIAEALPHGLTRANFAQVPFLIFNRKDDMQQHWVSKAFGVRQPRLSERYVPSSEAYVRAAAMGWGIGVVPELQARPLLDSGALVALRPDDRLAVRLYWHQWKLGPDGAAPSARVGLLDRVGDALLSGARAVLDVT
ncbi:MULTISPECIES: LysR family transcriptional regulator ArgP [unclassified Rhizobacter]|uniref:LysR family transcriptional regulator ArgP n=1 Tax=unclassified Rhizobacter TaxID=2640088 RepID=UPI0006FE511E|nr:MULTISPECIES: LysR family transcriptional regulator ArgP [unclassified Rhizobacter]KQU78205.1 LysR family transcriptional regulator [Rhizobacter sp. Root29]KQW15951.1 LysR family transcriptional regulator [Rhizobacter sp. Root1238]KRB25069.1 LysR family transcriptional regulator [Rhizobacter sp. Root16D2]